jgi:hypothetical protein
MSDQVFYDASPPLPGLLDYEKQAAAHREAVAEFNEQMSRWQSTDPVFAGEDGRLVRPPAFVPRPVPEMPPPPGARFAGMSDAEIKEALRPKILETTMPLAGWRGPGPAPLVRTLLKPGMP